MAHNLQRELIAGAILVRSDGDILLIRQRKWADQYSCFVGGHVKDNESIVEALIREVWEEVGLKIVANSLRPLGWREEFTAPPLFRRQAHFVFLNCLCEVENVDIKFDSCREIQEAKWATPTDALSLVMESNRDVIESLIATGQLAGE